VTLEDRVKLQLGELLWVNLNLAQQAEDAQAALGEARTELQKTKLELEEMSGRAADAEWAANSNVGLGGK
jgi:hypothetical protein